MQCALVERPWQLEPLNDYVLFALTLVPGNLRVASRVASQRKQALPRGAASIQTEAA
jgi:hypothetical protein